VLWKLKKNVTWHDGMPFTADDVVFNWQFALDPAPPPSTRPGFLEVSKVEKIDPYTVKVIFEKPQPFWAVCSRAAAFIPRHVFESVKGAGAREAVGMIKPVGTGPYRLVEFRTGDVIRAELNPNYHVPNRPYFDRLEIKLRRRLRRATRAVLQPASTTSPTTCSWRRRCSSASRPAARDGCSPSPPAGQPYPAQPDRSPDRGGRGALEPQGAASRPHQSRGARGGRLLVDRQAIQDHLVGRTARSR